MQELDLLEKNYFEGLRRISVYRVGFQSLYYATANSNLLTFIIERETYTGL